MTEYDYIVAGAGTAGCVVAARLATGGSARVLLLEAGGAAQTKAMTVPNAWPENLGSAADWGGVTTGQADAGTGIYPRGRVLGGSGSINAMAHVRGHRAVYDRWAAGGATGWDFAGLLPCLKRSEQATGRDPALRGTSGPVRVAPVPEGQRHPAARAFATALAEAGHPVTDDLSGRDQEGVAWVDLAIAEGQRSSPATAYLMPSRYRPNLAVETGCLVTRLTLDGDRCTGVSYARDGATVTAHAAREVILCAGAVGSAQLLLLSGIGPADDLRALGIDVAADVPGVGGNFQDHPVVLSCHASAEPLPVSAYNHGEVYAALRSDLAGDYPDLHVFPILMPLAPPGLTPPPVGFVLASSAIAPDSVGMVRLASAEPGETPLIDPGFLRDERDAHRVVAGLEIIREAVAGPTFAKLGTTEVWPGPEVRDRAGLRAYARRTVGSYYHPSGTCRMGADAAAVTDLELRVRGVSGLRVADASVLPVIPNAHLNATVLAVAERAAELIGAAG